MNEKKFHKLSSEVDDLKRDFYNLNYAANAMIDICDWTIRKPSNAGKNYKNAEKAYNTMADHFNKIQKHKHCIYSAMSLEMINKL